MKDTQTRLSAVILMVFAIAGMATIAWNVLNQEDSKPVSSYAECVAAGNPVMESYPEQCAAGGKTYVNPEQAAQVPENAL
jgi:flagellar basal body-associated protein FliL